MVIMPEWHKGLYAIEFFSKKFHSFNIETSMYEIHRPGNTRLFHPHCH